MLNLRKSKNGFQFFDRIFPRLTQLRPCLRQFLDLQVCNDLSTLCFRKISHFSFLMRLCSLSSPIGEDYPIYASPPETSFGCDGYIEVQSFLKIMFGLMFIVRSSRVTMPTPKLSARPSTSAPTLVTPTSSSTVSSAPTELSSTSSTSSVIGGSTLIARRFYKKKKRKLLEIGCVWPLLSRLRIFTGWTRRWQQLRQQQQQQQQVRVKAVAECIF